MTKGAPVVDAQPMPVVELGADADDIFRGHARVVVTQAQKAKGSEVDAFSVAPEAAPHEPFLLSTSPVDARTLEDLAGANFRRLGRGFGKVFDSQMGRRPI